MTMFSIEDKREVIRLRNEEHLSTTKISKIIGMDVESVRQLIHKYELHGENAFIKTYKCYSPELIMEVVTRANNGEAKASLAIEYNIATGTINSWIKRNKKIRYNCPNDQIKEGTKNAMKNHSKKLNSSNIENKTVEELSQQVLELQAEVEALKKLRALVLQRNARQLKKKQ